MGISVFFVAALIFAGSALSSISATLTSYISKVGKVVVILNGEIAPEDTDPLQQIIKTTNDSGKIVSGIRLNSFGGNLPEGAKLADKIRFAKIASVVPNGSTCASACFVAFAASADKYVSYSASIGVHGASDGANNMAQCARPSTAALFVSLEDFC
jgi:hypothetical protein